MQHQRQRGGAGPARPFQVLMLADEDLLEKTVVYFYIVKGMDDTLKTFFCQDDLRYYPPPTMQNYVGIVEKLS
jgi:hypothetical protein